MALTEQRAGAAQAHDACANHEAARRRAHRATGSSRRRTVAARLAAVSAEVFGLSGEGRLAKRMKAMPSALSASISCVFKLTAGSAITRTVTGAGAAASATVRPALRLRG